MMKSSIFDEKWSLHSAHLDYKNSSARSGCGPKGARDDRTKAAKRALLKSVC